MILIELPNIFFVIMSFLVKPQDLQQPKLKGEFWN